ncbi:hypothetical protein MJO28_010777 [Puccinia striiformis f. sp. tritici]|uniref:Uncharacterized protein n=1 Tax=Puccinia striiformis f. sp. tritici TaxID=168172 RepID=A0ACC0E5W3_9BASI|nr:hypothetical protein Pst134EA_019594 [Puccinia striiformis f. sp. tritici]KAH9449654.1 hypothetical protein Pst134EB_020473 [Puccinia striiformis f. sp. tritici]KAH9449675.1 hypothetical protein Pst134EB_020493 [Puccinia striiformis f. sp. tritici]KAH9459440.1 hypothetical protein Pst134EA_019594 [Puccinia striiformis f. sp. tritici]KAI7945082.1 hypothetical protein MJO28_010777 [Puccinia striiformis f. sp. tritici]KAI7948859.1 hypothetical protein MJO29_010524 [Puccinia striiformis f. sp. 
MNLALSVLPFLVLQVIMSIDPTSRKPNKFKSRSIPVNEALEGNAGGGTAGGQLSESPASPPRSASPPPRPASPPKAKPCCG